MQTLQNAVDGLTNSIGAAMAALQRGFELRLRTEATRRHTMQGDTRELTFFILCEERAFSAACAVVLTLDRLHGLSDTAPKRPSHAHQKGRRKVGDIEDHVFSPIQGGLFSTSS